MIALCTPCPSGKLIQTCCALFELAVAAAFFAGSGARPDADEIDGTMTWIMVGVAEEIFGGELPVRRKHPFVNADDFRAALATVAAVERQIEMDFRVA